MRQISDGENQYFLKANLESLILMDELGISEQIIAISKNQNQGGFKIIFELFHLFLNAGEGVKYTDSEAFRVFERVVDENGLEAVSELIKGIMEDDIKKITGKANFKKGVTELKKK